MGRGAETQHLPLLDDFPRVPIPIPLAMEAFSNGHVKLRENFLTQRDFLRDDFFAATVWQHLGTQILALRQDNTDEVRHLNGGRARWKYCYENSYSNDPKHLLISGACTTRALHLDGRELPIPRDVTAENYWLDLRDASLYGAGAILQKSGIPEQPKLYLADKRQ